VRERERERERGTRREKGEKKNWLNLKRFYYLVFEL
jgi:hypothetical protein